MGVELRPLGVRCNIQCQYCYQNPQRDAGNLNPSYDLDLMKAGIRAEGRPFALFGGEPLLTTCADLENELSLLKFDVFADMRGRQFMGQLQQSVVTHMDGGNDAMLHWGLENDQLSAAHLSHVPVLTAQTVTHQGSSVSKLEAFKTVRSLLFENGGANPSTLFRAFDNAFTSRMGF